MNLAIIPKNELLNKLPRSIVYSVRERIGGWQNMICGLNISKSEKGWLITYNYGLTCILQYEDKYLKDAAFKALEDLTRRNLIISEF